MGTTKIAITLNQNTLERLDRLVRNHVFANRSRAIQGAVQKKPERMGRSRLTRECAKLHPDFEKAMTEEWAGRPQKNWLKLLKV